MMTAELYNRICSLMWQEDVRLTNQITEQMNFILKYRPTDPDAYVKLAQLQAQKSYFDKYVFRLLGWLDGFVDDVH